MLVPEEKVVLIENSNSSVSSGSQTWFKQEFALSNFFNSITLSRLSKIVFLPILDLRMKLIVPYYLERIRVIYIQGCMRSRSY